MTGLQKAQLKETERRRELGKLLDSEERSENFQDLLQAAKKAVEDAQAEVLAAGMTEPEVEEHRSLTSEGAELRGMISDANVGEIFAAAFEKRHTSGVEAELQAHYGLAPHSVPLALLETRAITPAPTNTGASQAAIVQPIFHEGDAAYLSVATPTVGAGDAVYPVLTTRPTVHGPFTALETAANTTGAFTADMLVPSRLQSAFFYRRSDAARFAGMGEALRLALSSGLSEALDKEIIDRIVTDVTRTDASAADTFASYRSRFVYDVIEGRFASTEGDLRMLVGTDTLADMAVLYRGNNADDSVLDSLRRITSGVRVSPHIAATASTKQDVLIRRGSRMDAVAPIWEGITLIPDEVTKAETGEIVVTAVMLAAFKIIRTGGFQRIQAQHS